MKHKTTDKVLQEASKIFHRAARSETADEPLPETPAEAAPPTPEEPPAPKAALPSGEPPAPSQLAFSGSSNYWSVGSLLLDPGGMPSKIVATATGVGSAQSIPFSILKRTDNSARDLWLTLSGTVGTFTAFKGDLRASYDGGVTYQAVQTGIDLFASGSQKVTPTPPPGAVFILNITTFTGGTSADVLATTG